MNRSDCIRVALLGMGMIGVQHLIRMNNKFPGVDVVGIYDEYAPLAKDASEQFGIMQYDSPETLISSNNVDAVLICSSDQTHADYLELCLRYGKPAFCEKPLSDSSKRCFDLVEQEVELGVRLISVGYMRRFDRAYQQMKARLVSGELGEILMVHCRHRNAVPPNFSTEATNIINSMVHEFDILRWLTGDDAVLVKAYLPKKSSVAPEPMHDPQYVVLTTESGIVIGIESFLAAQYGYDVQCEVVAENGTISLPSTYSPTIRTNLSKCESLHPEWNTRFDEAYDLELYEWFASLKEERNSNLANTWDGYVATLTASIANESRMTGREMTIKLPKKPELYCD